MRDAFMILVGVMIAFFIGIMLLVPGGYSFFFFLMIVLSAIAGWVWQGNRNKKG